ncbi:MAG: UTRA domain-containing protein [Acidimicrobiia bacterium]|nr:UTRA domain-containing protein [Acidimicrobiia bacterium]
MDLISALDVGDAIPPERVLAAELGIARATLRRAIGDLVRDGVLFRRQGAGTFVAEPKIAQPLTMTSFTDDMRRRGHRAGSRTLSIDRILAGARLGRLLSISPSQDVVVFNRLRLADDQPMAIEILHVPADLVPGLTSDDLVDTSFYQLLSVRYGIEVRSGTQTIEPTVTNDEESHLLGLPLHTPAFLFERISHDAEGRTLEYVRSIYRGDRYRLTTELRMDDGPGMES